MWEKLIEMNLSEMVDYLEEAWAPDTYKIILRLISNLTCSGKFLVIFESPLYSKMVKTTSYNNKSEIRELSYALINLLKYLESNGEHQLHYYDCAEALVRCLQLYKEENLEQILHFIDTYLKLD